MCNNKLTVKAVNFTATLFVSTSVLLWNLDNPMKYWLMQRKCNSKHYKYNLNHSSNGHIQNRRPASCCFFMILFSPPSSSVGRWLSIPWGFQNHFHRCSTYVSEPCQYNYWQIFLQLSAFANFHSKPLLLGSTLLVHLGSRSQCPPVRKPFQLLLYFFVAVHEQRYIKSLPQFSCKDSRN